MAGTYIALGPTLGAGSGGGGGGGTVPSGTGFPHITGGSQDAVAVAINLATGHVTGVLPKANQGAQDMAGDVTGNTGAAVVAKVNGATVPAAGALVTGNSNYVSGASATTYSALNLAGGSGWVTGLLPIANLAAPDFVAQDIITTGNLLLGATPRSSAIGLIRVPAAQTNGYLCMRNNGNTADIQIISSNTSNNLYFGTDPSFTSTKQGATNYYWALSTVNIGTATSTYLSIGSNVVSVAKPLIGGTSGVPFNFASFAFTSDADKTLAPATNTLNKLTGTVTGTKNLEAPTVTGAVYWFWNATSAGAVLIKTAAGTGPTIANGMSAWVMCDGTNYVRMSADTVTT